MPKGTAIPTEDLAEIMARFNKLRSAGKPIMEACAEVAEAVGMETATVWAVTKRFRPTTNIAEQFIKAKALRLARRLVQKANPEQIIDVLSRPNIGVIAPKTDGGGGQGGFFMSINVDTCGAVKIGAAAAAPNLGAPSGWGQPALPAKVEEPVEEDWGPPPAPVPVNRHEGHEDQGHVGRFTEKPIDQWPAKAREAVLNARKRLKPEHRRRRRKQGSGDAQGADTQPRQDTDITTG